MIKYTAELRKYPTTCSLCTRCLQTDVRECRTTPRTAANTRSTYHRDYTATELIFSPNGIIRIGAQYLMHTNPPRFGTTCVVTGRKRKVRGWVNSSEKFSRPRGARRTGWAPRRSGSVRHFTAAVTVQPTGVGVNLDRRVGRSIRCDRTNRRGRRRWNSRLCRFE